jgi:hypothetical protein
MVRSIACVVLLGFVAVLLSGAPSFADDKPARRPRSPTQASHSGVARGRVDDGARHAHVEQWNERAPA